MKCTGNSPSTNDQFNAIKGAFAIELQSGGKAVSADDIEIKVVGDSTIEVTLLDIAAGARGR